MTRLISRRAATFAFAASAALATWGCSTSARTQSAIPLSDEDYHPRKLTKILDSQMSYVDIGHGDPIVFLHGNPTSSYLWRNIITRMNGSGRLLAPDLIGMGESGPSPTGAYRLVDHARYLDSWFEAVGATRNVTLVLHDWGSALGFHRAARFPAQIKRIAYMEAIVANRSWPEFGPFEQVFRGLRSPAGEHMVLDQNIFIEQILRNAVLKPLNETVMANYRAPFKARESRLPMLVWPREIPVEGQPMDVLAIVNAYAQWLKSSSVPKLYFDVQPGTIPPSARSVFKSLPSQTIVPLKGVHYVQEDAPEEISAALSNFIKRT